MRLNTLKPAKGSKLAKRRLGRGWSSNRGITCGRGDKGQKSRGKGKVALGFEGGQMPFQRRVPKSGFNSWKAKVTAEIRLSELNKINADIIDLVALKQANIISHNIQFAKIIATGTIDKAVVIKGLKVTSGAKRAIEDAGGKVED